MSEGSPTENYHSTLQFRSARQSFWLIALVQSQQQEVDFSEKKKKKTLIEPQYTVYAQH